MAKKEKSLAGLRVRHAVIDLLYRDPLHETALPSASALSEAHHISMSTVNRELKKLVEDGLIVGKRGIGMFTVPGKINFSEKNAGRRLVGLVCGDGRLHYYDLSHWSFASQCALALPETARCRPVNLISGHAGDIAAELKSQSLDGIIAIWPRQGLPEALQILRRSGFPAIAIGHRVESVPSIVFDCREAGRRMAALAQKRNIRSLLWMNFDSFCREILMGFSQYFTDTRTKITITEAANMGEFEEKIKEYAGNGAFPDAVYAHGETACSLRMILESWGIPFPGWLVLAEGTTRHLTGIHGIIRDFPYRETARHADAWMAELFAGREVPDECLLQLQISEQ